MRQRIRSTAISWTCASTPYVSCPGFFGLPVESGGVGAATITRFKVKAGGRTREYRTKVAEPEPGRILTESDTAQAASPRSRSPRRAPPRSCRSPPPGTAQAGSTACLSVCSRSGCCAPSTQTDSSDSTPTRTNTALHEPATPVGGMWEWPTRYRMAVASVPLAGHEGRRSRREASRLDLSSRVRVEPHRRGA